MNDPIQTECKSCRCAACAAYGFAALAALLIVGGLVMAMVHLTRPQPLNANRAAERAAALRDLRAAEAEALHTPAWLDPAKGIVRLPIENAMQLIERDWQDPAAGRSNLIARVEKATFTPPPPPPKPSAFE